MTFSLPENRGLWIIIQARMGSSRLPKKVMLTIGGRPILEIMLERLSRFKSNIIIATTNDGSESPIVNLCSKLGVKCFQGPEQDVLLRYTQAALHFGAKPNDVIVRCTSDCPLIDSDITEKTIAYFLASNSNFVAAGPHSGFPNGFDTEVFNLEELIDANNNAVSAIQREHLTQYIIKKNGIDSLYSEVDNSDLRLTLDEVDDLKLIESVYEMFDYKTDFSYDELVNKLRDRADILALNSHVQQIQV